MGGRSRITMHRGWQIESKRVGIHGEYAAEILSPDGRRRGHTRRFSGPGARDRATLEATKGIDRIEDEGTPTEPR